MRIISTFIYQIRTAWRSLRDELTPTHRVRLEVFFHDDGQEGSLRVTRDVCVTWRERNRYALEGQMLVRVKLEGYVCPNVDIHQVTLRLFSLKGRYLASIRDSIHPTARLAEDDILELSMNVDSHPD